MTQIRIDVQPETVQHIHAMLDNHRSMTFAQLAGEMLDAQVAYRLEVERMRSALIQHVGEEWL
jgi:hypothetical protein